MSSIFNDCQRVSVICTMKYDIQICEGIPVTNKEWMHKRPRSGHIGAGSRWSLTNRRNRRLICTTNTTASCRKWRWMVLPTMIMKIHARKSIRSGQITRYWCAIPGIVKVGSIWDTSAGVWGWWVNRPQVGNIWARVISRGYCCMLGKNSMLSK